jgi:hypothetical protein
MVSASDGALTTTQAVAITVTNVIENILAPTLDLSTSDNAVAQSTRISFASSYDVGDVVTLTVDGVAFSHTVVTGKTSGEDVYDALKAVNVGGITLANALTNKGVTWAANLTSNEVTLTGSAGAANAFTVTSGITNISGVNWVKTVDFEDVVTGFPGNSATETITINIGGTNVSASSREAGTNTDGFFTNPKFEQTGTFLANKITTGGYGVSATFDTDSNTFILTSETDIAYSGSSTSSDISGTVATTTTGRVVTAQAAPAITAVTTAADAPTGFATTFTEMTGSDTGANAVAIVASNMSLTDGDSTTLQSATITITNRPNTTLETLFISGSLPAGISSSYSAATYVLTLTGEASLASYQTALKAVRYNNASDNPDLADRLINITVNDGVNNSNTTVARVSIDSVNDVPTLASITTGTVADAANSATLGATTNLFGTLSGADVDTGNTLSYTITGSSAASFTSSASGASVTYDLSKAGTYGTVYLNAATGKYLYVPNAVLVDQLAAGSNPSESFTFNVSDGTATATQTYTINLTGANDVSTTPTAGDDVLTGTSAGETIDGLAGNDTIDGLGGNDIIIGGLGSDVLTGGSGRDTFRFANGDSAYVISGSGNNGTISGYDVITDYQTGSTQDILDIPGTAREGNSINSNGNDSTLTINSNSIISHGFNSRIITFNTANGNNNVSIDSESDIAAATQYLQRQDWGDAGASVAFNATINGVAHAFVYTQLGNSLPSSSNLIALRGVVLNELKTGTDTNTGKAYITPIALDLNNDGVSYLSQNAGVAFDYNNDGVAESTAWVAPEDGLLANQRADGSLNVVFSTQAGETDLEGLAKVYDTNFDAVFDSRDAGFTEFGVWQDANSDGIVQEGEFRTLADRGIVSLSLASDGVIRAAANGDVLIFGQTTYTMTDGSTGIADDVGFAVSAITPLDDNGVQGISAIASVSETTVAIDGISIVDDERVDLSVILNSSDQLTSASYISQVVQPESHSTMTLNIGGVDYEVSSIYGKEVGNTDVMASYDNAMPLGGSLQGSSWTDVVDMNSQNGGPASISTIDQGQLTNQYANEAGDWTIQIKSGIATVDAANKQINFTSDQGDNSAVITTGDGTTHEIMNIDKIIWH